MACSKGAFIASATKSGLVQCDVSVAAESVISLPPFVIIPSILFLKIWLNDILDTRCDVALMLRNKGPNSSWILKRLNLGKENKMRLYVVMNLVIRIIMTHPISLIK